MEANEMIFNLTEKLQYSKSGDFQETATLEFKAPSSKAFDEALDLSQMVMICMMDARNDLEGEEPAVDVEEDANQDIDPDSVRALLMQAQRVKMSQIRSKFDALALKCGTFDGEIKITKTTLGQLSMKDYTRLMCEYIANFIIPSLV